MGHQFLPLVSGGSFNFQLPMGGGSSYFITGTGTRSLDTEWKS